jgi:hypothetical protein
MSDIRSTRGSENTAGISGSDQSSIGGAGRKGGAPAAAPNKRIDSEVLSKPMNGMATGGTTGYGSGDGRTF